MKIKSLLARPILNSRAEWTVEVALVVSSGTKVIASVPQGKSTGASEAHALPAHIAVKKINTIIAQETKRRDFRSQLAFDQFLIDLDGTPEKSNLGANAILACSIAFARATAIEKRMPLWGHIRNLYGLPVSHSREATHPRLFMNLINGGLHGGSNLNIQEYVVIPKTRTFAAAADMGVKIYDELKLTIGRNKGKLATNLGDEGGFAPDFKNDLEPLRLLHAVVDKLKLTKQVDFGMDAAATDIKRLAPNDLAIMYAKLVQDKHFIYLEDPFAEDKFELFAALTARVGKKLWIAGDDLTTTNVRRMEMAHTDGSVNAVIIKPNQIGTVGETLDAIRAARRYGWAVVVSHRSGETADDFIADLAYGVGADGIKLGAPARGERVAKYNRLLAIGQEQSS